MHGNHSWHTGKGSEPGQNQEPRISRASFVLAEDIHPAVPGPCAVSVLQEPRQTHDFLRLAYRKDSWNFGRHCISLGGPRWDRRIGKGRVAATHPSRGGLWQYSRLARRIPSRYASGAFRSIWVPDPPTSQEFGYLLRAPQVTNRKGEVGNTS
ncbi:uncharacterized protein BCR38DRAFT_429619 [Pseudomassariella vexata]|uniref:Uncharacterized protein n=1 Tax=Pseudomassariella vexata TaxID=1141098 RepID=A0A1Y2E3X1_9PEZI|nr:uncharacterized protein BCR38DRAFT_429619 [Pseudomassariella vexata]ORY66222.1 hypothetical protein BCR38DRAFT_429619 [Pseudomassariella vexata]